MIKVWEIQNIFCRSLPCYSIYPGIYQFTVLPRNINPFAFILMSTTTIYYIVETENLEGKPHILLQWTLPKFSAQYPVEIFVKKRVNLAQIK